MLHPRCLSTTLIYIFVNFFLVVHSFGVYDVRQGEATLILTEDDKLDYNQKRLFDDDLPTRFIGDLVIGERQPDETIFRRTVEIVNPTDDVYSTIISLTVDNGIIHHLSVLNEPGSYAVACDKPNSLGTSKSRFKVRVPPNSADEMTE